MLIHMAMKQHYILMCHKTQINPIAVRTVKTVQSFGHSECNRVKSHHSNKGNCRTIESVCLLDVP